MGLIWLVHELVWLVSVYINSFSPQYQGIADCVCILNIDLGKCLTSSLYVVILKDRFKVHSLWNNVCGTIVYKHSCLLLCGFFHRYSATWLAVDWVWGCRTTDTEGWLWDLSINGLWYLRLANTQGQLYKCRTDPSKVLPLDKSKL